MSKRKTHLFPRRIDELVKIATKPLMDKQGKLYGALLQNWAQIVGPERALHSRPQKLQWPTTQANGAILHLAARAAKAPELAYETEQMVEQCARYFGYRAIARVVLHPAHDFPPIEPKKAPAAPVAAPRDMTEILQRMRARIATGDKP
jgi:hypothetical protein